MFQLLLDYIVPITILAVFSFLISGYYTVSPRKAAIIFEFGKFIKVVEKPGFHWHNPIGREMRRVSTKETTIEIPSSTVVDLGGSPIIISAVVAYYINDAKKAVIDVDDPHTFIANQSGAIIKRVCSKYPYDHTDAAVSCLRKESEEIATELVTELQAAVNAAGIKVISVKFDDLSYAPEIAQSMLMKQQAHAFIDARKTIVDGAVALVQDACTQLEDNGVKLSQESQEQLISNLLVILCSGETAQPVVQIQAKANKGV